MYKEPMKQLIKYDFDNIFITPERLTTIKSRYNDISPYYNGKLPLFTAPMDTVIDENNYQTFMNAKLNICLPRTVSFEIACKIENVFISVSLEKFNNLVKFHKLTENMQILIDTANGHGFYILESVKKAKALWPNIIIMAGNIANPETIEDYDNAGIDYVRVGIGGGAGCLTATQTGVSYAMASLIKEASDIKKDKNLKIKIIADGGMRKFSDIVKALALGADYVMVGSLLNKTLESCADNYLQLFGSNFKINESIAKFLFEKDFEIVKKFRGMSTKEVQQKMGAKVLKTAEGIVKYQKVEYTLVKWIENFESYLRSNMSYTNSSNLENFIGEVEFTINTSEVFERINK
jgi:GMP reductase